MSSLSLSPGRLLGVDFGAKRVGLAICDRDRRIASPFGLHQRTDAVQDARYFLRLVQEEEVRGIVVGLPVHVSGQEGEKAREARVYGAWLASVTQLPVFYWDERLSTVAADRYMLDAGLTKKRRDARRDMVAAQVILQAYLDAGCPAEAEPEPLI